MILELLGWGGGAFFAALLATGIARKYAIAGGLLDIPNERSSHTAPTPRGGGVAIAGVTLLGYAAAGMQFGGDFGLTMAFIGGGSAVAAIGWLDDRRSVSAALRLLVHVAAAVWAVAWLGGLPPIRVGGQVIDLGFAGDVLGVLGVVWTLNLFNFMDGIDGIAASESAFIGFAAASIIALTGASGGHLIAAVMLGAASLGFLWWNWPRARIFMGDVGSGFAGFAIAVLAIAHARHEPVALFIWAILGAAFIADSTVTLLRRLLRGVPVYQPHRSHAYQLLSDRLGSHRRVTLSFIAVNAAWLLPCAVLAWFHPDWAAALAFLALLPLVIVAILLGGGRPRA